MHPFCHPLFKPANFSAFPAAARKRRITEGCGHIQSFHAHDAGRSLGTGQSATPDSSNQHQAALGAEDSVPEETRTYLGYGVSSNFADGCLPYAVQDNFGRERTSQPFWVAVLENEFLRATILLDYGGRVWSLYHKPAQRELLTVNPVFQPANLAIRHAWYSGGIEWNCGVRGHTPFDFDQIGNCG